VLVGAHVAVGGSAGAADALRANGASKLGEGVWP